MNSAQVACGRLLVGLAACFPLAAQPLVARLADDHIRVTAPQLRFLTGPLLERLHNGAPVALAFQLSLHTDSSISAWGRDIARFVISYDLWEERFSVTRLGRPPGTASHLTAEAAQALCVDALALPVAGLPGDKSFTLKLEARSEDPKEAAGENSESAMSLARLVELFSRRARSQQERWTAQAGPMRLADFRKSSGQTK